MHGGSDGEGVLWRANPDWWISVREHIPWLRSQMVHIVRSGLEDDVERSLIDARFTCLKLDGATITTGEELTKATKPLLRLWDYCGTGWDSWRDCLSDLNDIWAETDRLALLWSNSDVLIRSDLPSWVVAISILEETSGFLQTRWELPPGMKAHPDAVAHRLMVFETFCFVDGFGAQEPTTM